LSKRDFTGARQDAPMTRRLTTAQTRVLLTTYAAGPDDGWCPDIGSDTGSAKVAIRLFDDGYLRNGGTDAAPHYFVTEAGRAILGVDLAKPPKQVSKAAKRGLAWLGFEEDACQVLVGRNAPVMGLNEGTADFRGCRFTLNVIDGVQPYQTGGVKALANEPLDDDLLWDALARFVTELGFPCTAERERGYHVGFWAQEE